MLRFIFCSVVVILFAVNCHAARVTQTAINVVGKVSAGSELLSCQEAKKMGPVIYIRGKVHLSRGCTYHKSFVINDSDTVLDCRGAKVKNLSRKKTRYGVFVSADPGSPLENVTVKNCLIDGHLNGIRVQRFEPTELKKLRSGNYYRGNRTKNIRLLNNHVYKAYGVGIYVHSFVERVRIEDSIVADSGNAGIYLDAGSRFNHVINNRISFNGYGRKIPAGKNKIKKHGQTIKVFYTGREGIAVDGSLRNKIISNRFHGNSAGGIFLYKNIGELKKSKPEIWYRRPFGASHNLIQDNVFRGSKIGVWVGSRMSENQAEMEGSDPVVRKGSICYYRILRACVYSRKTKYYNDYARHNQVLGNQLHNVRYGILVEDDHTTVNGNQFHYSRARKGAFAISIYSPQRHKRKKKIVGVKVMNNKSFFEKGVQSRNNSIYGSLVWGMMAHHSYFFRGAQGIRIGGNKIDGKKVSFNNAQPTKYPIGDHLFVSKVKTKGFNFFGFISSLFD